MKKTLAQLRAELDRREAAQIRSEREMRYTLHRRAYLPRQIEATRAKLVHLEREAARLGVAV